LNWDVNIATFYCHLAMRLRYCFFAICLKKFGTVMIFWGGQILHEYLALSCSVSAVDIVRNCSQTRISL